MGGTFAALSILVVLAEKSAQASTVIHFFLSSQHLWAWLTVALLLPSCLVQVLSFKWHRTDGHKECCSLAMIHVLQLGIIKRYWDSLWTAVKGRDGEPSESSEMLMQLGDLAILRLLEALLQTLPHLLLQAYIYLALEEADIYPGVSAGLSLLSLSWALMSYNRFMCLLKPGHLYMPWAALLCQLLWRMGMLGTRVMALTVFARVYHFWTLAVAVGHYWTCINRIVCTVPNLIFFVSFKIVGLMSGAHWLVMSFWLASQQTDIIIKTCQWKMFNILIGAVYIFCYVNLRDGSSRCRVLIFYSVMLVENIILLLLATDFLQEALWSSIWMTLVVMAGFVIGSAALIIYYSLLHPKSTEISQSFKTKLCKSGTWKETTDGSVFQHGLKNGASREVIDTLDMIRVNQSNGAGPSDSILESRATWVEAYGSHHHWLLLKLALKTGSVSKINAAFGDGGVGELFPQIWLDSNFVTAKGRFPWIPVADGMSARRYFSEEVCGSLKKREFLETSDYITVQSQHESMKCMNILPTVAEEQSSLAEPDELSSHVGVPVGQVGGQVMSALAVEKSSGEEAAGLCAKRADTCNNSTLYFSADMDGVLPLCGEREVQQQVNKAALRLETESALRPVPEIGEIEEVFPVTGISPILGGSAKSNFRRSAALNSSSQCDVSMDTSEFMAQECIMEAPYSHCILIGSLAASLKNRLKQEEEPCFTSTPKAEQMTKAFAPGESKARKKLTQLAEMDV